MLKNLIFSVAVLLSLHAIADEEATALPNPQVVIKTNQGDITLRLFADKAPITVANFLGYVDSGHYSGTIFHRVIPKFMVHSRFDFIWRTGYFFNTANLRKLSTAVRPP